MNFFDLADKLINDESASNPLYNKEVRSGVLNETTGSDAIAFLPSHLGTVKARVADLAKLKKDWKIEILEQEDAKEVNFEDSYRITVPNEHWDSFCSIFDCSPTNNSYLNLNSLLNETMEEEMDELRKELRVALATQFDEAEFDDLNESASNWKWRYGVTAFVTKKKRSVVVTYENRAKDIQNLYDRLLKVYGEDRGNLELLIEALRDKRPLNTFKVFKNYDYLYGTRIFSKYGGVRLYFECLLDYTYQLNESIYSPNADDLMDKVEEESREVKVVRNVIYPKGGRFTTRFLRMFSDMIDELGEEK